MLRGLIFGDIFVDCGNTLFWWNKKTGGDDRVENVYTLTGEQVETGIYWYTPGNTFFPQTCGIIVQVQLIIF